jgi:tRNA(Ile2) C34 agmatinyltransferase TiaS
MGLPQSRVSSSASRDVSRRIAAASARSDEVLAKARTCMTVQPTPQVTKTTEQKQIFHKVEPRETLWQIARKYRVSVEEIALPGGRAIATDEDGDADLTQVAFEHLEEKRLWVDEAGQPDVLDLCGQVGVGGQFGSHGVVVLQAFILEALEVIFFEDV